GAKASAAEMAAAIPVVFMVLPPNRERCWRSLDSMPQAVNGGSESVGRNGWCRVHPAGLQYAASQRVHGSKEINGSSLPVRARTLPTANGIPFSDVILGPTRTEAPCHKRRRPRCEEAGPFCPPEFGR